MNDMSVRIWIDPKPFHGLVLSHDSPNVTSGTQVDYYRGDLVRELIEAVRDDRTTSGLGVGRLNQAIAALQGDEDD